MDTRKNQGQHLGMPQEMFNLWTDMFRDFLPGAKGKEGEGVKPADPLPTGPFDSCTKPYMDFTKTWMELGPQLFKFWQGLTTVPPTPDQFRPQADLLQAYGGLVMNLFRPWLDGGGALPELMVKHLWGDRNSSQELIRLWNQNYEATFGKVLKAPVLGMYRQELEKQMHSFDAFMKYANAGNEFYWAIYKIGLETMEGIIQDYQGKAGDSGEPITFRDFYQYWWTKNEDAYHNLFNTEEFSQLLGQLSEASFEFKLSFDRLLEEQLKFLPFPTKTDLDSLYKTVHELKKQVRAMAKQLSDLGNRLNSIEQ